MLVKTHEVTTLMIQQQMTNIKKNKTRNRYKDKQCQIRAVMRCN